LHKSLIDEWEPSGPTEFDTVLSIAKCMWRKSRLTIYARAAEASARWRGVFEDRDNPAWSIEFGLMKNLKKVGNVLSVCQSLEEASQEVRPHLADVIKHSAALLELDEKGGLEVLKEGNIELKLASLGEQVTAETLNEEIELEGRLDARIDRLVKRLFQLKAGKQMLGLGSRSHDAPSPARKLPLLIEQGTAVGQAAVDAGPALRHHRL
jgi:hypothetical protein